MGAIRFRRCAVTAGILVFLLLAVAAFTARSALAWNATSGNLRLISSQEDRFWNYDLEKTVAPDPVTCDWCDWPVTIVFWGHASVAKVKLALFRSLPIFGIKEYLRASDNSGGSWYWDADRGAKSISLTKALHMRLYGGPWGRLTNRVWGSYVVATTHFDYNELSSTPASGHSETAAAAVEALCARAFGASAVTVDTLPMFNVELDRAQTRQKSNGDWETHYWQCDGLATMVYVP